MSKLAQIPGLYPPPDVFPGTSIDGQRYQALRDVASVPPLLVGIYSALGRLVDVTRFDDPRAAYCAEMERQSAKEATAPLFARPLVAAAATDGKADLLTNEQREILAMLVAGYTAKEIAIALDAGLRTIELRLHQAREVLDLGHTPLIVWAAMNREWLPEIEPPPIVGMPRPRKQVASVKRRKSDPTEAEIYSMAAALREGKVNQ